MKVRFAKDVLDDQNSWIKLDGFVDLFEVNVMKTTGTSLS
jgi:hypothetical protein